ncbi:MAG: hypothetical protein ACF8LK_06385 [Phycisphaerales bacterium JB041]
MARSTESTDAPRRKGRLLRRLVLAGVVLGVVLLVLVALAPTIAGPLVRPMVQDAVNDKIKGRATVSSLELAWFGGQRAAVSLADPDGVAVADVSVRVDRGLLGLALGSRDLGVIFIGGEASIVRDADGTTNLQRAIEPRVAAAPRAPEPGAQPASLPASLEASVVLDGLRVTYTDAAIAEQTGGEIGAVRLGALTGSVDFAVGSPVLVVVEGPVATGKGASSLAESGKLDLRLTVNNLTDASGTLTVDAATADVAMDLRIPAVAATLGARYSAGRIERTDQTRVSIDTEALAGLVPSLAEALRAQPGVTLAELPDLTLTVDTLSLPLSGGLAGLTASAKLETTRATGTVELPTANTVRAAAFELEPLTLAVNVPSMAETVTVTGGTRATIDGDSAGDVSIDLAIGGLADDAGTLRGGVPEQIEGSVRVEGFSTPILQPFVAALGAALPEGFRLDLPNDIGPRLDLALNATGHTDGSGAYDIDLALDAARAELDAAIVVQGQRITTRGEGVRGRFATVAPVVDRFAAAYGVRVERGAEVTFSMADLAVDLATLHGADGLDLRGVRAKADLAVVDAVGKVQLAGDTELRDYRLERLSLGIATDDVNDDVTLVGDMSGNLNGKPLAVARVNMTLAGLLDSAGAPATDSLPTLRGEIRVEKLALDTVDAVFGPLYRDRGLLLTRDVGPTGDIVILAASNPSQGDNATNLDLTFRSRSVDVTAPLLVQPDRLRSRDPVTLVDRSAGGTLASVLGDAGTAALRPSGTLRLVVSGLDVPIGPGGVRPDRIGADITATLTEFAADVGLPDESGRIAQRQRVEMPRLQASVVASSGSVPSVQIEGQFSHDEQPFTLVSRATLNGLFLESPADPANPMSVLALAGVVPESSTSLRGVPATLSRLVPRGKIRVGERPLDMVLLTRDGLGRTFDLEVATRANQVRGDTVNYSLDLNSEATRVQAAGRWRSSLASVDRADASIGVTPRVAAHLASVLAADAPAVPALRETATIRFTLHESFAVALAEGFTPDFSEEDTLNATVTLDAALAALTLPAAEGPDAAEPMTIPPLGMKGLSLTVVAPSGVMTESGGDVKATLGGDVVGANGASIVGLRGDVSTRVVNAAPAGEMPVALTLSKIDGAWIDTLLGKPALVAGSVGERFDVSIQANTREILDEVRGGTPLKITVAGPRFSTEEPIGLSMSDRSVFVRGGIKASWQMGPRWANTYFLGATPGGPPLAFSFTEQTRVQLDVERLALAYGEGIGVFRPGVFIANLSATVPNLAARLSDGRDIRVGGLLVGVGRGPTPDQIGLDIRLPRMKIGDEPEVTPEKSRITGRIASFADEMGHLTPKTARITLDGGFAPIPTAVIDSLTRQGGLLVDTLGPVVDFGINADEFGLGGGTLLATATAPFARAEIRGEVRDGLFIVDKSSLVEATRITGEATKRLQKALPMLASLEKTTDDRPARIIFETPIAVPMDGNMDRLNGKFTVDVGTARFGTAGLFEKVLSVAQMRVAGEVGRRMPPLKITMTDGLVSYEPYALPLGEFKIETQGFINLSSKPRQLGGSGTLPAGQLQVLTFIPAGAFAAEAVPGLSNLPLPLVGNLAKLPIRTSGMISSPKNDIAVDLVGKNAVDSLLAPGKLLEEGPGNLLKDLIDGGRKKDE